MRNFKRMDNINIVPFIDIMLVLLVIVLTSATFIAQGKIPIAIPKAQGKLRTSSSRLTTLVSENS